MRKFIRAVAACVLVSAMCITSHAETISGLQDEKSELEDKKEEAQSVVEQLKNEQNDILAAIKELDDKVSEYTRQIQDLEAQRAVLEEGITVTQEELESAKVEEQAQYEAMKKHIQYAYEYGEGSYLDTIFSSVEVSDIVNQVEYAEQIYKYDSNMLAELVGIKTSIEEKQAKLENDLQEVNRIEEDVQESKDAIDIMIEGKRAQVENYENSIDKQEKYIAQINADIAALDNQIAALEAEFARKQQEMTEQGQPPQVYYTGGTFQWPVSSGGTVTSEFGPRSMFGRNFHYGLDIACSEGTPILACEAGVVIGAGYSSSMGNYVVISHGNNVTTTYMHNSAIAVSVGQEVARAQVIAYAGSTGDSTGPHCHLGVRVNGSYVNPRGFL